MIVRRDFPDYSVLKIAPIWHHDIPPKELQAHNTW